MIRHLPLKAALAGLALVAAGPAEASWLSWFDYDRPVVYRPITTPRTVYFQPSPQEVVPVGPQAHPVRICRPHRHPHHACR